jgi:hypothetical protein
MTDRDRRAISRRRHDARRQGIRFTLTYEEMGPSPERCPCCGVVMERSSRPGHNAVGPTLERLDPRRGYTKENTIWLCGRCNTTKSNHGIAALYQVADFFWNEYKKRGYKLPGTRLRPHAEEYENV